MSRKSELSREQLEQFALEYIDVNNSCRYLAGKYNLSYKNLPRHMKRAVGLGLLGKDGEKLYKDAKDKRKMLSLHGRYFTEEKRKDIVEGIITYEIIKMERISIAKTIEEKIKYSDEDEKTIESNKEIARDYGNKIYGKPVLKSCITNLLNYYAALPKEEEAVKERKKIWHYRQNLLHYLNSLIIRFQTVLEKQILGRKGADKTNELKRNGKQ